MLKSNDGNIAISWLKNKKFLHFYGVEAGDIKHKLWSLVNGINNDDNNNNDESRLATKSATQPTQINSGGYTELSTDVEGTKLDLVISESRLNTKIESNINSLNMVREEVIKIQRIYKEIEQQVAGLVTASTDVNDNVHLLKKENSELIDRVQSLKSDLEMYKNKEMYKKRACLPDKGIQNAQCADEIPSFQNSSCEVPCASEFSTSNWWMSLLGVTCVLEIKMSIHNLPSKHN